VSRVVVIGSGISGLATAWLASRAHDVLLLERDARLGGHTHTHQIDTPDGRLALDTGFLVHNDRTYPQLIRLFTELGVSTHDSDMSFGVSCARTGFEFGTRNLAGLFADWRNLLRPGHYRLLADIARFNRASRQLVAAAGSDEHLETVTLGTWLTEARLGGEVVERFLVPLASAIWSTSPGDVLAFPAVTLARFFDHHGMNTILDHPTWRVVAGGSASYIPKLLDSPRIQVHTSTSPTAISRLPGGVRVEFANRPAVEADHVVFACHGDQVLPLLADATPVEREVFGGFETTPNAAVLHMDDSWLPRRPAARAAWNYRLGLRSDAATVTYDLGRLQRLDAKRPYLVTLNPPVPIRPDLVLATMAYRHPLYTARAILSQRRWAEVSGPRGTHFAGAYWFYGFHEDGLRSAARVAEQLGVRW
jgi:predicted NAD/FAD-binding protein